MLMVFSLFITYNYVFFFCICSNFCLQRDFLNNPSSLRKRLIYVGIGLFLISPCLVIFMLVYLFLRHAEQFYHHPSAASSRRWSNLSKWIFREFNEVLIYWQPKIFFFFSCILFMAYLNLVSTRILNNCL